MPVIRRRATDVPLPGPHVEHLTILRCAKHCLVRSWLDDGRGGHEAPSAMFDMGTELLALTGNGPGVLLVSGRPDRLAVNPAHFVARAREDGMTEFSALFYEASLHTLRAQLAFLVWPHG